MDGGADGRSQAQALAAAARSRHPHDAETDRADSRRRLALLGRQGLDLSDGRRLSGSNRSATPDGIGRCKIWLDQTVVAVAPRPMRAFQGWRYYEVKDAPPDIDEAQPGFAAMPDAMRRELASLGLI